MQIGHREGLQSARRSPETADPYFLVKEDQKAFAAVPSAF
jgi:hypothetical protein